MKVTSSGIVDGVIKDIYGKRSRYIKMGMPTYSLPIKIEEAPKGTVSFAIILDDPDAMKPCGKVWLHWLVADLTRTELKENESLTSFDFVQGVNDWNENCYGGMAPPDAPHNYRIIVYALNKVLGLRGDFTKWVRNRSCFSSSVAPLLSPLPC
jgi:Raf kinase inhibitor-like YbhB/YbcL family protein